MCYIPINDFSYMSIDIIFDLHYKLWDWIYNEIRNCYRLNKPITSVEELKSKYFKVHGINKIPTFYCYLCSKFTCDECPLSILLGSKNKVYVLTHSCIEAYDDFRAAIFKNNLI